MANKTGFLFAIFAGLAILLIMAAVIPSWRQTLQKYVVSDDREVLASAEGDLLNDGSMTKVIKFRDGDSLYVEILRMQGGNTTDIIDRILLPDKHDGLFTFRGHVTRLAIADIENNGQKELLAPSFDNQLVPHLNVFRYNSTTKHFEPYQSLIK